MHFEPGAKIHRRIVERHSDVAEIAGAVACRNIHVSAKRDSKVGKITAHTAPLGIGIPGCLGRARVLIAERYALVNVVADRLNQQPPLGDIPNRDHAISAKRSVSQ